MLLISNVHLFNDSFLCHICVGLHVTVAEHACNTHVQWNLSIVDSLGPHDQNYGGQII